MIVRKNKRKIFLKCDYYYFMNIWDHHFMIFLEIKYINIEIES